MRIYNIFAFVFQIAFLEKVAQRCPNLKVLDLHSCWAITNSDVENIFETCTKLEHLVISDLDRENWSLYFLVTHLVCSLIKPSSSTCYFLGCFTKGACIGFGLISVSLVFRRFDVRSSSQNRQAESAAEARSETNEKPQRRRPFYYFWKLPTIAVNITQNPLCVYIIAVFILFAFNFFLVSSTFHCVRMFLGWVCSIYHNWN